MECCRAGCVGKLVAAIAVWRVRCAGGRGCL